MLVVIEHCSHYRKMSSTQIPDTSDQVVCSSLLPLHSQPTHVDITKSRSERGYYAGRHWRWVAGGLNLHVTSYTSQIAVPDEPVNTVFNATEFEIKQVRVCLHIYHVGNDITKSKRAGLVWDSIGTIGLVIAMQFVAVLRN